jgi:hypothetical protein
VGEVTEGHPVSQRYGIGDAWIRYNLTHIAGGTCHTHNND